MPGLVPGIHVLRASAQGRRGWPGHRRAEATPFFERLCPAMTTEVPYSLLSTFQKIGVAGPSSTPVIDLRQALGIVNCPSGM
jgi:hypothetical protein